MNVLFLSLGASTVETNLDQEFLNCRDRLSKRIDRDFLNQNLSNPDLARLLRAIVTNQDLMRFLGIRREISANVRPINSH